MPEKKWPRKRLMIVPAVVAAQSASPEDAPLPTKSKQCYSVPCYGDFGKETVYERIGDGLPDTMAAFNKYDRLHANTYSKDTDKVYGNGGDAFVYVDDGDTRDSANGGSGYDWCFVDAEIEAANTCEKVVAR
jgi:hypothetical protein